MVSGKWNMAKFLPGGGGKRVSGEKGISQLHLQGGVWTLQLSSAGVSICTSPGPFQILSYCPQKIGVALDHDGGKVTFTNARAQEFIHEFSSAFTGRIFPFLWPNCMRSRLMLKPLEKTSWHSPCFFIYPLFLFISPSSASAGWSCWVSECSQMTGALWRSRVSCPPCFVSEMGIVIVDLSLRGMVGMSLMCLLKCALTNLSFLLPLIWFFTCH